MLMQQVVKKSSVHVRKQKEILIVIHGKMEVDVEMNSDKSEEERLNIVKNTLIKKKGNLENVRSIRKRSVAKFSFIRTRQKLSVKFLAQNITIEPLPAKSFLKQ